VATRYFSAERFFTGFGTHNMVRSEPVLRTDDLSDDECKALASSVFIDARWNVFPCSMYDASLGNLRDDHAFLTKGGVFDDDFLESYIALKEDELTRFRMTTHPVEFDMYYSL
jgi:MoaA/NifB/PqqE/SkfB family radical SAM enzyme